MTQKKCKNHLIFFHSILQFCSTHTTYDADSIHTYTLTHLHTYTLTHLHTHTHTHIISLSLLFLCNYDSRPVHHTKEGRLILYIFRPGLHKMTYMPSLIDPKQTKKEKSKRKIKSLKKVLAAEVQKKIFFLFCCLYTFLDFFTNSLLLVNTDIKSNRFPLVDKFFCIRLYYQTHTFLGYFT
ncbi:predicted protein [Lodderomyces elongisporus NRRL YB-4239]|uniref:Uncharacterized protein n=1 Tax=Lodderomyces elongisporus (strain ATCC 11503 / CBS 2605 / JCM 1781 / NBRC 1676 / NRRL YB-4239) TaxID=379508 RepID=A5E4W6_LODEL|nr:predicted protein [Lodderomyces elongisporus NRRL YB-4239]